MKKEKKEKEINFVVCSKEPFGKLEGKCFFCGANLYSLDDWSHVENRIYICSDCFVEAWKIQKGEIEVTDKQVERIKKEFGLDLSKEEIIEIIRNKLEEDEEPIAG